jgi:branched-chain amino acid transport system permease protein
MATLMGVRVPLLFLGVFVLGAMLAALAGAMLGPVTAIQAGMGEQILILVLVCIVIGGIGSVRGAFYSAMIVGLIDTAGRAFLPMMLREFLDRSTAQAAGPALASMLTCIFMAAVLALKPAGLFPVKNQ